MLNGWKLNLILLAIIMAGVSGLWFADRHETTTKAKEEQTRAVSLLKPDAVIRMDFQDADNTQVTLEKEAEGWRITTPTDWHADPDVVAEMLAILSKTFDRKVADTIGNAADFGLASPTSTLTIHDGTGKTQIIRVGNAAAVSGKRYVHLEPGPLALMAEFDVSPLVKKASEVRDKRLAFGWDATRLSRVVVKRATDGPVVLSRTDAGDWTLTQPFADQTSADRVGSWLNILLLAQGSGFEPGDPPNVPDWTIELAHMDQGTRTIQIWRQGEQLFVRRQGESDRMILPAYLAEDLDKPATDLASRRPLFGWTGGDGEPQLEVAYQGHVARAKRDKETGWPKPEWDTFEEILIREANDVFRLDPPPGPPYLTVTARSGTGDAHTYPIWKTDTILRIAPTDRPVLLHLSELQSESVIKALRVLFPEVKEATEASSDTPPVHREDISDATTDVPPQSDATVGTSDATTDVPPQSDATVGTSDVTADVPPQSDATADVPSPPRMGAHDASADT
jgi:hypothetical protein